MNMVRHDAKGQKVVGLPVPVVKSLHNNLRYLRALKPAWTTFRIVEKCFELLEVDFMERSRLLNSDLRIDETCYATRLPQPIFPKPKDHEMRK